MTPAPVLQVFLDTVPMPSMEVYSGTPGDATQHFEDWMQTQYSPLTVQLGKWLDLSDNDKATEFLGQLNKYFEQRTALLGEEGTFLFPSRRPSPDALQVLPFCPFLMCTQPHTMRITLICLVLRIHVGGTTPYPICLCLKGKLLPHLLPYFVVLVEKWYEMHKLHHEHCGLSSQQVKCKADLRSMLMYHLLRPPPPPSPPPHILVVVHTSVCS